MSTAATFFVRMSDGAELAVRRSGRPAGPALVCCNGLGGGFDVWEPLARSLGRAFEVWRYGYRGLDGSTLPPGGETTIETHARDLAELIDQQQIEAPLLVGWSMGVQVAIELHRKRPELASGLVALYGTSRRPLDTAFDSTVASSVAPGVFEVLRWAGSSISEVAPPVARRPAVVEIFSRGLQTLGWAAPELDVDAFRPVVESWLAQDLRNYADTFEALGEHDAHDLLASIETPALVIGGDRDRFTPLHCSEALAASLVDAELEVIEGTTHFGLIEQPRPIAQRIRRFVRERLEHELG